MKLHQIVAMGAGVLKARISGRKIPLNVMLSVTNRCTSRCAYCNIPARAQRELTTVEITRLVDEITSMGAQRLGLWGGEPLLRDDIGRIIDHAKRRGLYVTLDSNGYMAGERLGQLKNLDHFILSLDGPQEAHDRVRGKGSFQAAMKAAGLLKGRMTVWTITVLTKHNLDGIDFILDTARRHGFQATFQVLHHNDILGRDHGSLLPHSDAYREAVRSIILKKKNGAPVASSYTYLRHLLDWPDYGEPMLPRAVDGVRCLAGRCYCNVDTDGAVYPCSLLVGKMKSLNYLDRGFKKAFDGMPQFACRACNASCYTEYNSLFSLNAGTIWEWLRAMRAAKKGR
jgi:MoaA/NifB/PqqE/SkfB family radical SAM enzyme